MIKEMVDALINAGVIWEDDRQSTADALRSVWTTEETRPQKPWKRFIKRWVYRKPSAQEVVREMLVHTGKYLRDSKKNKDETMARYLADKYTVLESVLDRLAVRGIK